MHTHNNERGIALVLALFLITAMSLLGASLMFLSQTETYASSNYRAMSQSRYAAEAGIQATSHYLLDQTAGYPLPASADISPTGTVFDVSKSPVQYGGADVVLSWDTTKSNYPDSTVKTNFAAKAGGTLTAGNWELSYKTTATLIGMQAFDTYGGVQQVIQTWSIVGDGGINNSTKVTVEVTAIVETPKVLANGYAAFATAVQCASLNFGGTFDSNSYDSSGMNSTSPEPKDAGSGLSNSDGDVGTNGNLAIGGNAVINGNFYTPRKGVGTCTEGNVTATTETALTHVNGSMIALPKEVTLKPPVEPAWSTKAGPVDLKDATACADMGFPIAASPAATCVKTGDEIVINGNGASVSLPQVKINGKAQVVLVAGVPPAQYNFNGIFIASQSNISVKSTDPTQKVVVDIVGRDSTGAVLDTPVDFQGGSFAGTNTCSGCAALCPACSVYDATALTFLYSGTSTLEMRGNSGVSATVYAPLAAISLGGTADFYGSVVGKTVASTGNVGIHYDRKLESSTYVAGQPMVGTFSWKRF